MAITAWSAKVLSRSICRSLNGRTSVRRIEITPIAWPARIRGTANMVRWPTRRARSLPSGYSSVSTCTFPVQDGASRDNSTRQGQRVILRDRPLVGNVAEKVAVHLEDRNVIGVKKAGSARRHHSEHALEVRWRA